MKARKVTRKRETYRMPEIKIEDTNYIIEARIKRKTWIINRNNKKPINREILRKCEKEDFYRDK